MFFGIVMVRSLLGLGVEVLMIFALSRSLANASLSKACSLRVGTRPSMPTTMLAFGRLVYLAPSLRPAIPGKFMKYCLFYKRSHFGWSIFQKQLITPQKDTSDTVLALIHSEILQNCHVHVFAIFSNRFERTVFADNTD